jgi:hypothetical protein
MEGVNSTKIYCKHFCKCHSGPPVQLYYNKNYNKKIKRGKRTRGINTHQTRNYFGSSGKRGLQV